MEQLPHLRGKRLNDERGSYTLEDLGAHTPAEPEEGVADSPSLPPPSPLPGEQEGVRFTYIEDPSGGVLKVAEDEPDPPQEAAVTPQDTFTPPDMPPAPSGALDAAKRLVASLLTSKKLVTAVVGIVVASLARRGIILEPDMVTEVVGLFAVLVAAQGATDFGKEKAKVQAAERLGLVGKER